MKNEHLIEAFNNQCNIIITLPAQSPPCLEVKYSQMNYIINYLSLNWIICWQNSLYFTRELNIQFITIKQKKYKLALLEIIYNTMNFRSYSIMLKGGLWWDFSMSLFSSWRSCVWFVCGVHSPGATARKWTFINC